MEDQPLALAEEPQPSETIEGLAELLAARADAKAVLKAIKASAKAIEGRRSEAEQGLASLSATSAAVTTAAESANAHAQRLQQLVETAEADGVRIQEQRLSIEAAASQASESTAAADTALETAQAAAASAGESAKEAEALRAQVEQEATGAAARSEHIEAGRIHADDVRGKLDTILKEATEVGTETEAQLEAIQSTASEVTTLHASALTTKATIDATGEAVTSIRNHCDAHMATTKRLADTAELLEASIKSDREQLDELKRAASEHLKTIEGLLHGATSAGLAHAFDKRSKTFQRPAIGWQVTFIVSLALLLGLAFYQSPAFGTIPGYSDSARMLLSRIPFIVPLVWMAVHAARQASLAKRMEEEYAFKATISTSFEGYRRELAKISSGDFSETSPLATLCNETLRTIGAPPGQVYEKHRMDPTPATATAELVNPFIEGVSKVLDAKLAPLKPD